MNRYSLPTALLALALSFWLTMGCQDDPTVGETAGTDTGNALYLTLSVQGKEEPSTQDIENLDAWIGVEGITLRDCDAGNQTAAFSGPFALDLSADDPLGTVEASRDSICQATVELLPFEAEEHAGPLDGLSIYASGVNANGVGFEIRSRQALLIDHAPAPIDLQPGHNDVVLRLDVAAWLEGIDWESAERVDETVLIDHEHNQADLDTVHQNIMQGMRMEHHRHTADMDGTMMMGADSE